jgi:hypothetical protein
VTVSRQAPRINRRTAIAVLLAALPLAVALLVLAVPALTAPIGTAAGVAAVAAAIGQWLWPRKPRSRDDPTDVF